MNAFLRMRRRLRPNPLPLFLFFAAGAFAHADPVTATVPRVTIYPGDRIDRSMLTERTFPAGMGQDQGVVASAEELIGKVARRTLLPDQLILSIYVENPRLVTLGARTKIVFSENGVVITSFGIAQQAGAIGDIVHVRNLDSGLMVVGRVQKDGSVLVSEG